MKYLTLFIFGVVFSVFWIYSQAAYSQKVTVDKAFQQTNIEPIQREETIPKNIESTCLNAEYPKRKSKYLISVGVLNTKAIDIPKPEYPAKARARKIFGDVVASIFVDESGKVIWAKIDKGHFLLQKAVKKVVCQAVFKPATISGHPYSVSGIIIYRFILP